MPYISAKYLKLALGWIFELRCIIKKQFKELTFVYHCMKGCFVKKWENFMTLNMTFKVKSIYGIPSKFDA